MRLPPWPGRHVSQCSEAATKVAQISNRLYRRFPIGRSSPSRARLDLFCARRLKTCDTADWKSALQCWRLRSIERSTSCRAFQ